MNLVDKLTTFLEEEKILPITQGVWESFNIDHSAPRDEQEKRDMYNFIKSQVDKRAGIYVYMKDGECIYIGKAKLLYDRMKSHYIESFSPVPGDTKDMRWHRFFSHHQGEVEVFWKEFESEQERQVVEILLTKILEPVFLSFK